MRKEIDYRRKKSEIQSIYKERKADYMKKVKVIFRKNGNDILAFLPEIRVNYGNIMSYMHIGQHSEASYDLYNGTKRATEEEYKSLLEELKQIYDDCILEVRQRLYYDDLLKSWQ
nr:MAG TPA: hypothetical protein [Caudoviricetes sp.]